MMKSTYTMAVAAVIALLTSSNHQAQALQLSDTVVAPTPFDRRNLEYLLVDEQDGGDLDEDEMCELDYNACLKKAMAHSKPEQSQSEEQLNQA